MKPRSPGTIVGSSPPGKQKCQTLPAASIHGVLWSSILKLREKNQFALVNVGSHQQFLPLELHKPEVPDSSREINGWTAPHLTPHWSSSLWVWDPPYGPSCFKISDDDGLGRTLSEVCPPVLYIPLHARDLILLTPGLLYALWHSLKKKKPYYDPTCKCFEWRELKDAKKFLPQILNPHQTVEMPAWQQTLRTWWNSASVWHYLISCLLFKISIF